MMNAQERILHDCALDNFKEENNLPSDFDGEDCLYEIEARYGQDAYRKGTEGFEKRNWICEWLFALRVVKTSARQHFEHYGHNNY